MDSIFPRGNIDDDDDEDTHSTASKSTDAAVTFTGSLREAVYEVARDGRRFSALSPYPYSTGEQTAILERSTHVWSTGLRGLYYEAPGWERTVEGLLEEAGDSGRILDIGCGTQGVWVMDMAERFPRATVVGVDLFPIEPEYVPSNTSFEVFDVEQGLPFRDGGFHLIHVRHVNIFSYQSDRVFREIARCLVPGGCAIFNIADTQLHTDPPQNILKKFPAVVAYGQAIIQAVQRKYPKSQHHYTGFDLKIKMEDSGCFTNVHSREWLVPVGARKGDSQEQAEIGRAFYISTESMAFREFELFRRYSEEPTPDTIEGTVLEEALRECASCEGMPRGEGLFGKAMTVFARRAQAISALPRQTQDAYDVKPYPSPEITPPEGRPAPANKSNTRSLIFPPPVPHRTFAPPPEAGYTQRNIKPDDHYTPRFTKGSSTRDRLAFCEFCGLGDLSTKTSIYRYHLLHHHNTSTKPPYLIPAPVSLRSLSFPRVFLSKEEACQRESARTLEAECPFRRGTYTPGQACKEGWHPLHRFREAVNAHLGGQGLIDAPPVPVEKDRPALPTEISQAEASEVAGLACMQVMEEDEDCASDSQSPFLRVKLER